MNTGLDALVADAETAIASAPDPEALERLRIVHLGRKSPLFERLRGLGDLPPGDRKAAGALLNGARVRLETAVAVRAAALGAGTGGPAVDVTLPGRASSRGAAHPIPATIDAMLEIFRGMGFGAVRGPEVVTETDNFDFLNTAPDHPARDMQDTFYLAPVPGGPPGPDGRVMLRGHTSAMWRREMARREPPVHLVFPGRVYRRDAADATHSPVFHQVEGLWVDDRCRFSDLRGVLEGFFGQFFGRPVPVRFEPRFFPFTEPSTEVSIECTSCRGRGCPACARSGWLEVLGAGMVHPNILAAAGRGWAAPGVRGFAFGIGVERLAMLKHGITDMRWLYDNDLRVLAQVRG